jgi:alpha-tubulin suppressor-like RCC1 family protein
MLVLSACGGGGGSSPPPVANVTVTPTMASVMVGQQLQVGATTTDAMGNPFEAPITWASSDPAIATVSATGVVLALALGLVTITATSEGKSAMALVTATKGINFIYVSAGGSHTCALAAPNGLAYCWGNNSSGQLGNGTTTDSATPVPVLGGINFAYVTAGDNHTCAGTEFGNVWCWGDNSYGQLGSGTTTNSATPVLVVGGLTLLGTKAGVGHTCAFEFMSSAAYCWGNNSSGQLGNGTLTNSSVPVAVAGGFRFLEISPGSNHTCAVRYLGDIPIITDATITMTYCWGDNSAGQLGNGTMTSTATPAMVEGSTGSYRQIASAGDRFSCGVDHNQGYCWGLNDRGQLGDGTMTSSTTRLSISGGRFFGARISAGARHACGAVGVLDNGNITATPGYCWGDNSYGQLGNGTIAASVTPVIVAGGLNFQLPQPSLSAGPRHTCGIGSPNTRSELAAYCWGDNTYGQLGNSWTTNSSVPVNVAGPQ